MSETEKERKVKRRTAKSRFTRYGKNLNALITADEDINEIKEVYGKYVDAYEYVVQVNLSYTELLDDDKYEEEEKWMDDIQTEFSKLKLLYRKHTLQTGTTPKCSSPAVSPLNDGGSNEDHDSPTAAPAMAQIALQCTAEEG